MSELRRHIMMQQAGGAADYVMDGLSFWLDAHDYETGNPIWKERILGWEFETIVGRISAPIKYEGSVWFTPPENIVSGDCGYFVYPDTIGRGLPGGTVEICIRKIDTYLQGAIMYSDNSNNGLQIQFVLNDHRITFGQWTNDMPTYNLVNAGNKTLSVSYGMHTYLNKQLIQQVRKDRSWRAGDGNTTIGRGSNLSNRVAAIYSIRIYNRYLTEEEVLHNQQVDNEWFNLGL